MDKLPLELKLSILRNLNCYKLLECRLINKEYNLLCTSDFLWKNLTIEEFGCSNDDNNSMLQLKEKINNWLDMYKDYSQFIYTLSFYADGIIRDIGRYKSKKQAFDAIIKDIIYNKDNKDNFLGTPPRQYISGFMKTYPDQDSSIVDEVLTKLPYVSDNPVHIYIVKLFRCYLVNYFNKIESKEKNCYSYDVCYDESYDIILYKKNKIITIDYDKQYHNKL